MDLVDYFYDLFWSENIWLPKQYKWNDIESSDKLKKAKVKDLYMVPVLFLCICLARYIFEKFAASKFCLYLGIESPIRSRNFEDQKLTIKGRVYSQVALSTRETLLKKSTESCWRAFSYFILFGWGVMVVSESNWFWNNSTWLTDYKYHELTLLMKWYFFLEISFYLSLSVSQFTDTKRKDFYQMLIHHFVTLFLLIGSYITSMYRFAVVIMFIHDASDFWLETAKIAKYAKCDKVCNVCFGIFAIVFVFTRLIYYPIWVSYGYFVYNTYDTSIIQKGMVSMCFLILFLNFYWGYLVVSMLYRITVSGKKTKDSRSDNSDSDE
ncbi:ceramide synthase 6 [Hydra vulgaris]|uniref:Ceramide synthase 6 n=1 Tax=Hydra vulgaris TaxID=6087 RepID=A0ABM4BHZ3_HYDVU